MTFEEFASGNKHRSCSQFQQDLWVLWLLQEQTCGCFVEFGAGDGKALSNTYLLEKEYSWTGVVAEPATIHHDAIRMNRCCYVSHHCVVPEAAGDHLVLFHETDIPDLSCVVGYEDSDFLAGARNGGKEYYVPAIRLNDLLHDAGAPAFIDYMSVDTEGSELDILSKFDFDRYHVRLLSVEHNGMPERKAALQQLMEAHGMQFLECPLTVSGEIESWFWRKQ